MSTLTELKETFALKGEVVTTEQLTTIIAEAGQDVAIDLTDVPDPSAGSKTYVPSESGTYVNWPIAGGTDGAEPGGAVVDLNRGRIEIIGSVATGFKKVVNPVDVVSKLDKGTYDGKASDLDAAKADKSIVPIGSTVVLSSGVIVNSDYPFIPNSAVNSNGTFTGNENYDRTDYISTLGLTSLIISKGQYSVVVFFDGALNVVSYVNVPSAVTNLTVAVPLTSTSMVINNRKALTGAFTVKASGTRVIASVNNVNLESGQKLIKITELPPEPLLTPDSAFTDETAIVTGIPTVNAAYRMSESIDLTGIAKIRISKGGYEMVDFFDADGIYLSRYNHNGASVVNIVIPVPDAATAGVFNDRKANAGEYYVYVEATRPAIDASLISLAGQPITTYLPKKDPYKPYKGLKMSVLTDSIGAIPYPQDPNVTAANIWHGLIRAALRMRLDVQSSIGGTSVSDLGSNSFYSRYAALDLSSTDILIIEGGMNDLGYLNAPLGVFDYVTALSGQDKKTFIPAYRAIIEGIQTTYTNVRIVLSTIPHRTLSQTAFPWKNATTGLTWVDFNEAIRKLGRDYHLQVIDFSKYITYVTNSTYTVDGVHPNVAGHSLIAKGLLDDLLNF